jgi:hypothetical protein
LMPIVQDAGNLGGRILSKCGQGQQQRIQQSQRV